MEKIIQDQEKSQGQEQEEVNIERERLYPVPFVAKVFGVSERTIYNGVAPKAKIKFPLKPRRINRLLRFKGGDILDLIDGNNS